MLNISALNQKLNMFIGDTIENVTPSYYVIDLNKTGTTIIPGDADAFNLRPPISGPHQTFKPLLLNQVKNGAVYRGLIGYVLADKMAENDQVFLFEMIKAINIGLIDLSNTIGDLTGRKIWIKRPGMGKEYFRDMENATGVEFRLYVEKIEE